MDREIISKVHVNEANEFVLSIEGKGDPFYQYIYREAAGVYWDENSHGFKSTPMKKDWSCSQWYSHIVGLVESSLNVELIRGKEVTWSNIPDEDKNKIVTEHGI